jgi:hypothetical protein
MRTLICQSFPASTMLALYPMSLLIGLATLALTGGHLKG